MKKFQNTPENVITMSFSREMSLNNDSLASHSRSRKSSNYLFQRNSEQSIERIDDTSRARDNELQRQTSKVPQESSTSDRQVKQKIGMKTGELRLMKKTHKSRKEKRSSDSESEPGQINATKGNSVSKTKSVLVEPMLSADDLILHELKTRAANLLHKGVISEGSTDPALPRSKSQISRKVANNSTDTDRASLRNTSRVSKKVSKENSVCAGRHSRASIDVTSAGRKSSKVSRNNSASISTDLILAKRNLQPQQSKSHNNSEKALANRISLAKISSTSIDEITSKSTNKLSKNSSRARSRSESIINSTRRRSEANIQQNQQPAATSESTPSNIPSTEPEIDNLQRPNQNVDSNSAADNEQLNIENTNRPAPLSNENQPSSASAATVDRTSTTKDTVSSVQSSQDDEQFTSPTDRQLNPEADIQQLSRETRNQPIPTDPNSANVAKQDLEAWLRTASQSDTLQPKKSSINPPYLKFPVIRPCDKDITKDPEDCKKKLEQKLERMYQLKQAYYADPGDNMPFINLAYTKEGVFVDEPIERAFVFDEAFLQPNENSPNTDSTRVPLDSRSNLSRSVFFSPIWLNSRNDTASPLFSNQMFAKKESPHSKWMDKTFEEAEINMIENVLHDFQYKFNKLAANVRTISSSSETSSISEPVRRSRERIIIPNKSSRSNK